MGASRYVPLSARFGEPSEEAAGMASGNGVSSNGGHGDGGEDLATESSEPRRPALPQVLVTRLATLALWALVVFGALAGFAALAGGSGAAPPTPVVEATSSSVGPEGFAELYVAAWLEAGEGEEEALKALYPDAPPMRDVDAGSTYAARTATVAAEDLGEGYWSVTVAAEVLVAVVDEAASPQDEPGAAGYRRHGAHFYRVGVVDDDGRYVATSLPAEVPAPSLAEVPPLAGLGLERPKADDPIATAVGQFLAAYLAGEGEIERYITPGAPVRSVDPAPFSAVEVTRLARGEPDGPEAPIVVRAEATATTAAGGVQILHYALELSERQGRWEVRQVLPAVPLESAQRQAQPKPSS